MGIRTKRRKRNVIEISRKEKEALMSKGVKMGNDGILKSANYNRRYYLVESSRNIKLLRSLEV